MNKNGNFKSTVGFVLACVGSAVGMGNIWMFPYRLGQYGGAAFLIPYLIFIALFGLVGLSAEFALGRMAKTGTLGAYTYCWKNKFGKYIGKSQQNINASLLYFIYIPCHSCQLI